MQFVYHPDEPVILEGTMTKMNKKLFERWQKRIFKLQGRCLYYFKKNSDPPCGKIPLIDIEILDLPAQIDKQFGIVIHLLHPEGIAKRSEYHICFSDDATKKKWFSVLLQNRASMIVGKPYEFACTLSDKSPQTQLLLPYFMPSFFQQMNNTGYKLHGIWTVDVPKSNIEKMLSMLNMNNPLPLEDIHSAVATVLSYLNQLPTGFIPESSFSLLTDPITPEQIRSEIMKMSAPSKTFIRTFGKHLKKVLSETSTNGVTISALSSIIGPIFIKPTSSCTLPNDQIKLIQEHISECFLNNVDSITDDVHEFKDAISMPVLRKARFIQNHNIRDEDLLDGPRGLLVSIVKEDVAGWCLCYTNAHRVGLVHNTWITDLSPEEVERIKDNKSVDSLLDAIREKAPELSILFDSIVNENNKMKEALDFIRK